MFASDGNNAISGSSPYNVLAQSGSCVALHGSTLFYKNIPTFSQANIAAAGCSQVYAADAEFVITDVGTVSGSRYLSTANGFVDSGGAGEFYFPGSLPGMTSLGGQYR